MLFVSFSSDRLLKQSPRPGGVGKEHGRGSGGGRAREVIASASIFSMGPGLKNTGRSESGSYCTG